MTILGPRALIDIAVPTGVDANVLMRFQMEEGMTAAELIGIASTTIGEANQYVEQRWGGLFYVTEQIYSMYRQSDGTRTMTPKRAEFVNPDGVRGDDIGHMLPRNDYEDATAWSADWLERAVRELIRFDLQEIRDRWINRCDYEIILRMLSALEVAIGSAGYSVPWAIGTGMQVNYIPPQWRGYKFTSSHTHFIRVNGAISTTNTASTLESAAKELSHHGLTGRKVALVSESDVDSYLGMDGKKFAVFKPREFMAVQGATNAMMTVEGELAGIPGEIFGYFASKSGVVEMRYHERIPAGYGWMGKTFGVNNPKNPLAIRTDAGKGFGLTVNPTVNNSLVPQLDTIEFKATHGVGVNDRLNGVAWQIAAGSATYDEPTIS